MHTIIEDLGDNQISSLWLLGKFIVSKIYHVALRVVLRIVVFKAAFSIKLSLDAGTF